jgi:DNA-binding transcriptional ArsR family regulator
VENSGAPGDDGEATAATAQADVLKRTATVSNVDVLKALADPLRLNLLYALSRETGAGLPVMSVKELAAELGEPQTKLYRHIKHLESAGLIHAVASRVVSGILEQRYQARRGDLTVGDDLTEQEMGSPEAEAMAAAAMEFFRRQFFAARRAGHDDLTAAEPAPYRRTLLAFADGWVPASRAAAIREQLRQMLDDLPATTAGQSADGADEDMVQVNVLIGYFTSPPPG